MTPLRTISTVTGSSGPPPFARAAGVCFVVSVCFVVFRAMGLSARHGP
jgi:hypothetical protein